MLNTVTELHNNKTVRMARCGNGETVIFLHGYPENLQLFSNIVPLLSGEYETIAFDWPGMGYSAAWPGDASPQNMAENLLRLMDAWQITKANLIGQDMGGQAALVFAAVYPDRVVSVTVMNSLLYDHIATSWEIKVLRFMKLNNLLLRWFPNLIFKRALATFFYSRNRLSEAVKKDLRSAFVKKPVLTFVSGMCQAYERELKTLPAYYKKINCPLFILWAEQDKHFPVAQGRQLARDVPHATLKIIKNSGHWMVWEKAEELADLLTSFYRSLKN